MLFSDFVTFLQNELISFMYNVSGPIVIPEVELENDPKQVTVSGSSYPGL